MLLLTPPRHDRLQLPRDAGLQGGIRLLGHPPNINDAHLGRRAHKIRSVHGICHFDGQGLLGRASVVGAPDLGCPAISAQSVCKVRVRALQAFDVGRAVDAVQGGIVVEMAALTVGVLLAVRIDEIFELGKLGIEVVLTAECWVPGSWEMRVAGVVGQESHPDWVGTSEKVKPVFRVKGKGKMHVLCCLPSEVRSCNEQYSGFT